jgi:hypothetical protein
MWIYNIREKKKTKIRENLKVCITVKENIVYIVVCGLRGPAVSKAVFAYLVFKLKQQILLGGYESRVPTHNG